MASVAPSRSTQYLIRHFSWQPLVESDWSRGIVKDLPRSSIPPGGLYDAVDFLCDQPGVLRKRGGTAYQSSTLGATTTGVNFVAAAEYPTGVKVMGLGADGHLYDCTSGSSSDIGVFGITTLDTPKLYVDKLVVTSTDGTTAPKKVTVVAGNLTVGNLGGSPPAGKLAAVHVSRVVLAGSAANPNRAWFSQVPNVEATWDTSNAYVDFNHSLSAVASVQGVLLGFSGGATERLVGDIPPGTVGENMRLQPVGQIGCADARSIAAWGQMLVFASQEGVYVTNGAGFDSLTEKPDGSGILSYWRQQYSTVQANGGFISGGIVNRNYYIVTLGYGSTIVDTLVCYLPRKAWTRTANIGCVMYAPQLSGTDELFGATMSGQPGNRLLKFAGALSPDIAGSNMTDADGDAVAPVAEFRMSGEGVGLKAYGDAHLTYELGDHGNNNPTLAVYAASGLWSALSTYGSAVAESPLVENFGPTRKRFSISRDAQAVNVKVAQTNASTVTNILLLEVEQRPYDLASETQ